MNATSIQEMAAKTVDAFQQHGYTVRSVKEKQKVLQQIVRIHEEHGVECYNEHMINEFVRRAQSRYESGMIDKIHYRFLIKTVTYLVEFHATGRLRPAKRLAPRLSDYYEDILSGFLSYENLGEKARRGTLSFAKCYFKWLLAEGYDDLHKVDEAVVRRYLINCAERMASSSLSTTKRALKRLCAYLHEAGYGNESFDNILSFPVLVARKIKRAVPREEIAAVLDIIDRDTVEGKRDYAMILLSTITGLRSVDIVNMKLSDIDWINGEIRIVQSKTEESLALPLTTDVGVAVRDYILNGRPACDLDCIFLRVKAPLRGISHPIIYGQYNGYRAKLGLPKDPVHALRRSLGTNMVIAGVPVTTVAQVLGHAEIDSTKPYISLDTEHLKECALDFTGIELDVKNADKSKDGETE